MNNIIKLQYIIFTLLSLTLSGCISLPRPGFENDSDSGGEKPVSHSQYHSGSLRPYNVQGVSYVPHIPNSGYEQSGLASWYGPQFNQQMTSDGERFDMEAISAAHKTLPLPCIIEVTNLDNGRKLRVRVNDRGPFVSGRILDLSKGAARILGVYARGTAHIRLRFLGPAKPGYGARLSAAGWVEPKPQPLQTPVAKTSPQNLMPHIQIGAFASIENAKALQSRVTNARIDFKPPHYVVTVGPYATAELAQNALQSLNAAGINGVMVMP